AVRRSQAKASSSPPPRATPSIAAMVGVGNNATKAVRQGPPPRTPALLCAASGSQSDSRPRESSFPRPALASRPGLTHGDIVVAFPAETQPSTAIMSTSALPVCVGQLSCSLSFVLKEAVRARRRKLLFEISRKFAAGFFLR
ncbi:hypothetical protein GOODEAATRI_033256, partial [Goodea atripinnis]